MSRWIDDGNAVKKTKLASEEFALPARLLVDIDPAASPDFVTKALQRQPALCILRPVEDLIKDIAGVRFPVRLEVGRNKSIRVIDALGDRRILSAF
jgi:hypothetical protein